MRSLDEQLRRAAQAIRAADALLITAGAGMGVDSGLPDFRGPEGFWRAYPALARLGVAFEEMANPAWFRRDPYLAWAFYGHRLNLYRQAMPHAGFNQLLEIGSARKHGYFVFTSNVDGHFQKAGFAPERIVECHGSIHHFQCVESCTRDIWEGEQQNIILEEAAFRALDPLPRCKHCSGLARPNILMFGDWSWLDERTERQADRFSAWLSGLIRSSAALAVLELGAGTAIPTVRHTSERMLRQLHAVLVRINPREAAVPAGQIGLALGAAEGLRKICDCLKAPPFA
jgi:NAD-dependent SIR2 family protein deacetylase